MGNDIFIFLVNHQIIYKTFFFTFIILIFYFKLYYLNIKISVIIPTYNRGNLIRNSITSVLNQSYKNLEVIIVDDGSTDNTSSEINKIKDDRVRYIKLPENTGGSNARNIGIKNAVGKFISFQDSDDIFYPEKLEKQLKNIINKNSNLDFCKIRVNFNSSYYYFIPNPNQEKNIIKGNMFDELLSNGNFISTQSIIVRKKFIEKYYFDSEMPRLQDYDLILRMIPKVKISYTKEALVDLNIQKDSIQKSKGKLKKAINLLLNKSFNFNSNQKKQLSNYLNYLLKTLF